MEETSPSKYLLLRSYDNLLNRQIIFLVLYRLSFIVLFYLFIIYSPLGRIANIALHCVSALLTASWFIETYIIRRRIASIRQAILKAEELFHPSPNPWQDSYINFDYRNRYPSLAIIEIFLRFEPLFWISILLIIAHA
jgi:hypothetical protein